MVHDGTPLHSVPDYEQSPLPREPIRQLLGLPEDYKLVSLIPLGYPVDVPQKDKRPLEDVLHWERYRGQAGL